MKQKILLIGVTYTRMNTIIVYYITKQELECGNTISPFVSVIFNTNQNDAIIIYFTQSVRFYVLNDFQTAKKINTTNNPKFTDFVYSLNERNFSVASSRSSN